ncbi:acetyl-CoA carboxylase biotin carboxylase subunit [Rhodococcus pyridinivorans]|uniref:acetyl-CoA carboxylase biotin carboxylase subunit n=1 Tax=Rhodococcus pyridinivorans TaxID=103816 RepID=UPI00228528AB|nr:acetyl-CoA carboxylase biotin carboxylase subunit [Rhodococcus pyridinivorans]WAL49243.1 acetyl-CoA carboxylase biotin carboxylase subunit [Rhodococcus pyridinivorans]
MRRVLIANRGEIAVRIVRACFDEGIESVLAVSECDRDSLAARLADRTVAIGPSPASDSYLSVDRIVAAALFAECDAIHPGYGFLSERTDLVEACAEHGITFIGPPAEVMRRSGDKLTARHTANDLGIPTGSGTAGLLTVEDALAAADALNDYPLLLKASAGGGGRGMTVIRNREDVQKHFSRSSNEAERAFGDGTIYLERYVEFARHVEVQIVADSHGNVCHLGERDCSTQRRYQKLVEEAPAVGLPQDLLERVRNAAVDLAKGLGYIGAGTVEFLVDTERNDFVFLEVNARVQVEHPVTEMVSGIDIVREQLRIAQGHPLSFSQEDVVLDGHAIECRINAEDVTNNFLPRPGRISRWVAPQGEGIRIDTYAFDGAEIPPYYDSMIAKLIVHSDSRENAIDLMARALEKLRVEGVPTTAPLHSALMADKEFQHSPVTTKWLEDEFLPSWEAQVS